ncbi:MAG TPA: WxcM-like domain-containing protein [Candidatus Saccharibacteria bacterium]|nr:WxcM-like domain-containing protein [Candidatus Saccharibacteria bacterium]HRQ07119.1 WxcM-like domain-containing protein [Candidatus Saccharibacteria bacterium]
MDQKPTYPTPRVTDIQEIKRKGPWDTKSGGSLNVLFSIGYDSIQGRFLRYERSELEMIGMDIRGLRSYTVTGLKKGSVGAHEWHRLRNELVFTVRGSVKWTCEDTYGEIVTFSKSTSFGLWIPPFTLHTYESLEDNSEILVFANTLFLPDDPTTHDTFDATLFQKLQNQYITKNNS